jgi:hypothetical protein
VREGGDGSYDFFLRKTRLDCRCSTSVMMVVHENKGGGEVSEWLNIQEEAEKKGKVSYSTWLMAKRRGVDPDSLREGEIKAMQEYQNNKLEYSDYVRYNNSDTEVNKTPEKGQTIYSRISSLEKITRRHAKDIKRLREVTQKGKD